MDSALLIIFLVCAIILSIWVCIVLPAKMARVRNRSPVIWVLISLVASPVLAILLLLALGDAEA